MRAADLSLNSFARLTFASAVVAAALAGALAPEAARACEADGLTHTPAETAARMAVAARTAATQAVRSEPSIAQRAAAAVGGQAVHEIESLQPEGSGRGFPSPGGSRRVIVRGGGEAARRAVEVATGAQAVAASGTRAVRLTGERADAALSSLTEAQRNELVTALQGVRRDAAGARDAIDVRSALIAESAMAPSTQAQAYAAYAANAATAARASSTQASSALLASSSFNAASFTSAAMSAAARAAATASSGAGSYAPAPTNGSSATAIGSTVRPGFYDTSEVMAGRVAVNVVFVESTRSGRGWSSDDRDDAMSDLVEALDMWAGSSAAARLSFVYRTFRTTTPLQPIEESSERRDQWIQQAMEQLGSAPYGGDQGWRRHYMNVYELNNRSRDSLKTDWAFTVFFVRAANSIGEVWDAARNGLEKSRFTFADGQQPFTMLGGPYMVMPFSKVWGVHFWNAPILSHEAGHAFYARDEYEQYAREGHRPEETTGYFNVQNQNLKTSGAQLNESCIMRGSLAYTLDYVLDHIVRVFTFGHTSGWDYRVCRYTRGQIGQLDANANGRLDFFDAAPTLSASARIASGALRVDATAAVVAATNRNAYASTVHPLSAKKNLSIDSITKLRWRVDGGAWREQTAPAGASAASFAITHVVPATATRAMIELVAVTAYGVTTTKTLVATR